jgi:hypothetical protein
MADLMEVVQQLNTSGLREYSGLATNRFAIP